jgi:hypothetical protein
VTWNYRIIRSKNTEGDAAITGATHYFSLREVYYNKAGEPCMMTENAIRFGSDADDAQAEIIRSLEMAISDVKRYPVLDEEEFEASEAAKAEREVHVGSGNVFADLGYPDAEERQDKCRKTLDLLKRAGVGEASELVPNETTIAAMEEARAGNLATSGTVDELMADLSAMPEAEIDTTDIPEVKDWSGFVRGKFYRGIGEDEYRAALKEIEGLMAAEANTPEGERLNELVSLVETYEAKSPLLAAARALLPYLETSTDPSDDMSGWTIDQMQAETRRRIDNGKRPEAQRLRDRADQVEAQEAAIWRFRKAVAAIDTPKEPDHVAP